MILKFSTDTFLRIDMLIHKLIWLATFFSVLVFFGCESDTKENIESVTKDESLDVPLGLVGNTYRNQKYFFKVSNLPTEKWTVLIYEYPEQKRKFDLALYGEEYTGGEEEAKTHGGDIFMVLPLKDPTDEELSDFNRKMDEDSTSILMDILQGSDIKGPKEMAQFDKDRSDYTVETELEIYTRDGFPGYRTDGKWSNGNFVGYAYFTRNIGQYDRMYRFLYMAEEEKFKEIKEVYDLIIGSLTLNIE